jgi:carboxypeptidase D
MVPYDVPVVAHDMILRFMGVDFNKLGGGTATRVMSAVGDNAKKIGTVDAGVGSGNTEGGSGSGGSGSGGTTTPEQDKAMWEGALVIFTAHDYKFTNSSSFPLQHTTTPAQQL